MSVFQNFTASQMFLSRSRKKPFQRVTWLQEVFEGKTTKTKQKTICASHRTWFEILVPVCINYSCAKTQNNKDIFGLDFNVVQ